MLARCGSRVGFRAVLSRSSWSVVMSGINPHRLGFSRSLKSTFAIKLQRSPVGEQDVLMKPRVTCQEHPHQACADASALILWMNEQVGVINNQVTIGDGVAQTYEPVA